MFSFDQILRNLVHFIMFDIVYKYLLVIIAIILVIQIVAAMLSKNDHKEKIIDSMRVKVIGFVILIALPYMISGFIGLFTQITGIKVNVDTSIIDSLKKPAVSDTQKTPTIKN